MNIRSIIEKHKDRRTELNNIRNENRRLDISLEKNKLKRMQEIQKDKTELRKVKQEIKAIKYEKANRTINKFQGIAKEIKKIRPNKKLNKIKLNKENEPNNIWKL